MNSKHIVFSAILLFVIGVGAQKSRTYKERFSVGEDAVLELNTTHADVEFETWAKDEVEIVATITLEEADQEEVAAYFKKDPITIMGNSKKITVSTLNNVSWAFNFDESDFDIEFDAEPFLKGLKIPDLPELMVIPELADLPPLPPVQFKSFDHDKYKKEGHKYLEEWADTFADGFDKEYEENMKEWSKKVEENAKMWEERNAAKIEAHQKSMEERTKAWEAQSEAYAKRRAKLIEERAKKIEKKNEAYTKRREALLERREKLAEERAALKLKEKKGDPAIFFFSADGAEKQYKVKKHIKIKMPKSVRLKMNVKHGEVKLAATTKDLKASLRYASLLANTIEGEETSIQASYTPMVVKNWQVGQLKTDYSDPIKIKEVANLKLNAISSMVTIDRLSGTAFATSNLGKLVVQEVNPSFTTLDVSLQNGELVCKVPQSSVSFYINGTKSAIDYPASLPLARTANFDNVIYKGNKGNGNAAKNITINAKYSQVSLKE